MSSQPNTFRSVMGSSTCHYSYTCYSRMPSNLAGILDYSARYFFLLRPPAHGWVASQVTPRTGPSLPQMAVAATVTSIAREDFVCSGLSLFRGQNSEHDNAFALSCFGLTLLTGGPRNNFPSAFTHVAPLLHSFPSLFSFAFFFYYDTPSAFIPAV